MTQMTPAERPLAVGDLVRFDGGDGRFRVDALYPDGFARASVTHLHHDRYAFCFRVADLTRIEETADDTD